MNREELEARAAEIDGMERDGLSTEELEKLAEEREGITRQLAELRMQAAKEAEKRDKVAKDNTLEGKKMAEETKNEVRYSVESPEYRTAFFKMLQKRENEMTAEERTAYVTVTGDSTNHTGYLLPTQTVNKIWDMIQEQHSIVRDIDMYRDTNCTLEFPIRASITQGDAADVNEGAANDDEENVWGVLTLSGQDISKHIDISYKMMKMSIPAFEAYIINEISERIGAKLAADIITMLGTSYDSTHNAITSAAVKAVAWKDIAETLAVLKNKLGNAVVYGNSTTIYKYLVGMVDTTGRPIYQPSAQAGEEGVLVGKAVEVEDAIGDNILWIGYPKAIKGNMVQDIMIENDRNIKKHTITYAGYACFEPGLIAPKAFAKLTVKQS